MAENSNTYTTTTTGNEPAKPIRLTKKGKENVNKTVSNRTSKKTGISEIDFEDIHAQIHAEKYALEDKLEDQYSLFMFTAHPFSQRNSLSKDDAVIPSNSIGVNRNKFDNNAILLFALLERIHGKEETLFIVAKTQQ